MRVDFDEISLNINNKSYNLIGSGSGRLVFDLENGYVAKMAKNKKGFAQNSIEKQIAAIDHSGLFAKIEAVSEDSKYVIMEKADKINHMSEVWEYFHVRNNRELFRLKELNEIITEYQLLLPDLYRPYSWGLVKNRPVIIDFGFTREVRRKYYPLF